MLSPLCSQQCSKLTSASPVDLLAEDGFSIIGFSILFSFPHLQSSRPLGGLLPLQSFVAFLRFSDRIGSGHFFALAALPFICSCLGEGAKPEVFGREGQGVAHAPYAHAAQRSVSWAAN